MEDGGGEGIGFGWGSGRRERRGYARGCLQEKTMGEGRAVEGEDELITDHAACQG